MGGTPAAPAQDAVAVASASPPASSADALISGLNGLSHDNNRSDTLVIPTVTAGDFISEPLPVPTVLYERDEEPTAANPITYRERVFAVAFDTPVPRAEALARQAFSAIKRSLSARPRGRFVAIAVFDHEFVVRPTRPPLVVLRWRDWRNADPEVDLPDRSAPLAPPSEAAPPTPAVTTPAASVVVAETPTTTESISVGASALATIPDSSLASSAPDAMTSVPPAEASSKPADSARIDERNRKNKRKRTRTGSENRPFSAAEAQLRAEAIAARQEAQRDAPTLVVPVFVPAEAPAASPPPASAPTPAVAVVTPVAEPTPTPAEQAPVATPVAAPVEPPPVATPVAAPVEPPPVATPVAAPVAAPAEPPVATPVETPPVEVAPAAPAITAPVAEASAVTALPAVGVKAAPVVEEAPVAEKIAEPTPAAPVSRPSLAPERSAALTGRRLRGKDLVSELFDQLDQLSFVHSADEACAVVVKVLRDTVLPDACTVALYDIDKDEFYVQACAGVELKGTRNRAATGHRATAIHKREALNVRGCDASECVDVSYATGAAVFAPAYHQGRLFAMIQLQRAPGGPVFENDEVDGINYVVTQLGEALSTHSRRVAASEFPGESTAAPRRR